MASSKASSLDEDKNPEVGVKPTDEDPDAEFGGHEARRKLEQRLLRKLDLRMSILVVIYILNYVRLTATLITALATHNSSQVDRNNAG